MSLPILPSHRAASNDDLIRYYHKTNVIWAGQIGEEAQLDCGTAFTNAQLDQVHEANQMLDASLGDEQSPEGAVAEVEAHFRAAGARCFKWIMNPAVPAARTQPLVDHLLASGYSKHDLDIMYLSGRLATPIEEVGGLQIIPARASYRHARALWEEWMSPWNEPQLVEKGMLHLEDAATDALVALKDGVAAAFVAVLPVGEIGCIEELFVSEKLRGQGIGRTMMSRALEICARSLFKHVFLEVDCDNERAVSLYETVGFRRIAAYSEYHAPQTRP